MTPIQSQNPAPNSQPSLERQLQRLDWSRAHRTPIQMRYSDTDAMGHLNNAIYVQYLETSRMIMLRDTLAAPLRTVLARVELDYRQEIKLGQEVVVESVIERVGTSSWTVASRMLADGVVSAVARSVEVHVDQALRPTPLPDEVKAALAPLFAGPQQTTL